MTRDLRLSTAVLAGRACARASRALHRGRGATVGGLVVERLAPGALRRLSAGRDVILVTGTNGKSTTTRLTVAALGGDVCSNGTGSNLPRGLVWALATDPRPTAVLEVDELHLPAVLAEVPARAVIALNLSRDQLDRAQEVRRIARSWRDAFARADATVVANAQDPLVVAAASGARDVLWVDAPTPWTADAVVCPVCGEPLQREDGHWACTCGLARPPAELRVTGTTIESARGERITARLGLPGAVNVGNAAFAAAAAGLLGAPLDEAVARMREVRSVAGRYAEIELAGRPARLLLAKNPAGWQAALAMLRPEAVLALGINARTADGADPSWLWDVPFEQLAGRVVAAFGERASDLAVRLRYADVPVIVGRTAAEVAAQLPPGAFDVLANYTAFDDVLRSQGHRGAVSAPHSPSSTLADHAA